MKVSRGGHGMVTAAPTALRTRRIHNWFRNRITFPGWMFKIMKYITKGAME